LPSLIPFELTAVDKSQFEKYTEAESNLSLFEEF